MSQCHTVCRSTTASSKCGKQSSAISNPVPILPIFVNAAAPPIPTYRRARQLGESVGRFAMRSGKRVLFAASGGLSHDPPVPSIKGAPLEIRERLINGRNPTAEAKEAREKRVFEAAVLAEAGEGPCKLAQSGMGRRNR